MASPGTATTQNLFTVLISSPQLSPSPSADTPISLSSRSVKSLTPRSNGVWDTVGPEIRDLVKARKINWSSVDPARFFTHGPPGEEKRGSLGPVVIWVGVIPDSTPSDTAHEISQRSLRSLKNGVEDGVVELREAVT